MVVYTQNSSFLLGLQSKIPEKPSEQKKRLNSVLQYTKQRKCVYDKPICPCSTNAI